MQQNQNERTEMNKFNNKNEKSNSSLDQNRRSTSQTQDDFSKSADQNQPSFDDRKAQSQTEGSRRNLELPEFQTEPTPHSDVQMNERTSGSANSREANQQNRN